MAIRHRQPKGGAVRHSDRGSQYTSLAFGKLCFATLECELIDRQRFRTTVEARTEIFGFTEGFYNTRRLHSALGYLSLANFERLNHAA